MTIMSKTKLKKKKQINAVVKQFEEKNHIKKTHHKAKKRDLLSVCMNAKLQKKPKIRDPITESPVDAPQTS